MEHPDKTYNLIAGKNIDRLAGLSDGIFAFALTLLMLNLRLPDPGSGITTEYGLWLAVLHSGVLWEFVPYLMSFLTLGIFWIGQQTQLNGFTRADRGLTWLNIAFLLAVTLVPLTTQFLSHFMAFRIALVAYWLNILLLGVLLFATWRYGLRHGFVKYDAPVIIAAVERRIVGAQALYAGAAALCFISTYLSIGLILLVQLNFVFAPRIRWIARI